MLRHHLCVRHVTVAWQRLVFAIVLSALALPAAADTWRLPTVVSSRSYGVAEGLASGGVLSIAEDPQGYLWLGTDTGLVRFDGFTFRPWALPGHPELSAASIRSLLSARDGSLWIAFAGDGGIARLKGGTVALFSASVGVPKGFLTDVVEDESGNVWVGGRGGVSRYSNGSWNRLSFGVPANRDVAVQQLLVDREQRVWVVSSEGLHRSSEGADVLLRTHTERVRDVAQDSSGAIWVIDQAGRLGTVEGAGVIAPVPSTVTDGGRVLIDKHGSFWISTPGGVWHAWPGKPFGDAVPVEAGSVMDFVNTIYEDRRGTVWVGTRGGLVRVAGSGVGLLTAGKGLSSSLVWAVYAASTGTVWVAGSATLDEFGAGGQVRHHDLPFLRIRVVAGAGDSLWLGTASGIGEFRDGKYRELELPDRLGVNGILALAPDNEGGLWFCHTGSPGPVRWSPEGVTTFEGEDAIRGRPCITLHHSRNGDVWIGFADGRLARVRDGRFVVFSESDGLAGGSVLAIRDGGADDLWVGSAKGLTRYRDGRFISIGGANGLPETNVVGLVETDGSLWCQVGSGLLRIATSEIDAVAGDPAHRVRYRTWGLDDGIVLPSYRYAVPNIVRGPRNRLWIHTLAGVAVLDLSQTDVARPHVQAVIDGIEADGEAVSLRDGVFAARARSSRFRFLFSAISLSAPSKVELSYRLEGVDATWVDAQGVRQATYAQLKPGRYRFAVRAIVDGREDSAVVVPFDLPPAFYQTAWFVGAVALGSLMVGTIAWRARLRSLRQRHALVLQERTRIAREIHDTILQSLAGLALKLEDIAIGVGGASSDAIRTIRREVEGQIADARRAIAALRTGQRIEQGVPDAIHDAVTRIADSRAHVETVTTGSVAPLDPAVGEDLVRIAEESTRNAVRHGMATRVLVEVRFEPRGVRLRVSDDGVGFEVDREAEGHWGLLGIRERVSRLDGNVSVTSAPGRGTVVDAFVPMRPHGEVA